MTTESVYSDGVRTSNMSYKDKKNWDKYYLKNRVKILKINKKWYKKKKII